MGTMSKEYYSEYNKKYKEKHKNNNRHRLSRLLQQARIRSKKSGVVCDITLEDLMDSLPEDMTCPVLGVKMEWGSSGKGKRDKSPSIDRFLPKLGYTKDNICIISWRANMLKSDASYEEMVLITEYMKA